MKVNIYYCEGGFFAYMYDPKDGKGYAYCFASGVFELSGRQKQPFCNSYRQLVAVLKYKYKDIRIHIKPKKERRMPGFVVQKGVSK